jgi:hypothetical protein
VTPLTRKFRRIRSRIFRDMIRNVDAGLHEYDIAFKPTRADLRDFWSTANNCAIVQQATENIRELRREIFR